MKPIFAGTVALAAVLVVASGCSLNKAQQGAIIGATGGGAVGAVIGHATGSTARGAIIGAAVGGVAGAVIGDRMDRQAAELAYDIPGATVSRVGEGIAVTFAEGSLFAFNSDVLLPTALDNMRLFAASLARYPDTRALIVGHTDSQGSSDYNAGLSERRAQSTADVLVNDGVGRLRLSTAGRGEMEPIATNDTDAGRALNRRVEVAIFASDAARASN